MLYAPTNQVGNCNSTYMDHPLNLSLLNIAYVHAKEILNLPETTKILVPYVLWISRNLHCFHQLKIYCFSSIPVSLTSCKCLQALEKYRFEQSLEHTSQYIEKLEEELEEYQKHVALYKKRQETTTCNSMNTN